MVIRIDVAQKALAWEGDPLCQAGKVVPEGRAQGLRVRTARAAVFVLWVFSSSVNTV